MLKEKHKETPQNPHERIALLFDQERLTTYESFAALGPDKKAEIYKLIKRSIEINVDERLVSAKRLKGLKTHFAVTKNCGTWSRMPTQEFLRKSALYSEKAIITFPIHEVTHWNNEDMVQLFQLITYCKPFLHKGYIQIVPECQETRNPSKYDLVSTNFTDPDLEMEFSEICQSEDELFRPLFRNIKSEDVVTIRCTENDMYNILECHLVDSLCGKLSGPECEDNILKILKDIHIHVSDLSVRYRDLKSAFLKENVGAIMALAVASGVVYLLPPLPPIATVATTSLAPALAWLQTHLNQVTKLRGTLKSDVYYLVWRLSNPEADCLDPKAWEKVLTKALSFKDLKMFIHA